MRLTTPLTLKDSLVVSGKFRISQMDLPVDVPETQSTFPNASDYFTAFFNSEHQGWRPQNWLGLRFRALRVPEPNGSALVELTYTTQRWRTGPALPDDPQHVEPDDQWHTFVVLYNP